MSSSGDELLAQAVRTLTDAARRSQPDWAEFVTQALAGAAANIGSIEAALAGRPGSWEAEGVRQLLWSTVGQDGELLLEHRTDPVVVDLYVDEILDDLGVWKTYDDAQLELQRRYEMVPAWPAELTDEQQRLAEEVDDLQERLEQQKERDWAAFGEQLKTAVEAAAARLTLPVPVVVNFDLETYRAARGADEPGAWVYGIAEKLREDAILGATLPGDGRPPLERLIGR